MGLKKEFLEGKAFHNQVLTVDMLPPQLGPGGEDLRTGAFAQPAGDIVIRIYAPKAGQVQIRTAQESVALERQESGVFEGVLAHGRGLTGPVLTDVYVDGALLLSPCLPICWADGRPCNYVEVPDSGPAFAQLRDVPHGVLSRELFYSQTMGGWERCLVYTPAGYMKDSQSYPVVYLAGGGSDNELAWEYFGLASQTLDNLMADGQAQRFIAVMCNGMLREGGTVGGLADAVFGRMLAHDVIPFIEKNYRAKTGKWNRAAVGLGMEGDRAGGLASDGLEQFGWTVQLTAGPSCASQWGSWRMGLCDFAKRVFQPRESCNMGGNCDNV